MEGVALCQGPRMPIQLHHHYSRNVLAQSATANIPVNPANISNHTPMASPGANSPLAVGPGPTPPVGVAADADGNGGLERVTCELARLWT
jgi:hypothetical protein